MIKQFLTVAAVVGLMSGTALAQGTGGGGGTGGGDAGSSSGAGSGSQNLNHAPPTGGGVGPTGTDQAPAYRDQQGNPCTAGAAGCSRVDGTMKTQ